ncbi:MAG: amidohydrolase family protein [Janthinobacterium lividum]
MDKYETPRIDAHHHLWSYSATEFDWLQGDLAMLRRDFLVPDLMQAMRSASVTGAVAVQARQTVAETDWLLQMSAHRDEIAGVVGWLPLADASFKAVLEPYLSHPRLKGLRHVVQGEPAGFMDGVAFDRGISSLAGTGLVYDLLIHAGQLQEATRLVDRHPKQSFVLDHVAKPKIAAGELEPWRTHLLALAKRPNVTCKVSGMVTEAGASWTAALLEPYFDVVLEAFSPQRLMIGSDWPVLTAHCTYASWWRVVEGWIAALSVDEQAAMLGGTVMRTYRLALSGM